MTERTNIFRLFGATLTLAVAMLAAATINAQNAPDAPPRPVVGTIDFGGTVTFDTTSLATATRVNQWNSSFVLQSTGDFSSIASGTNVTMGAPWIFNPSTAKSALWSVGGFTFDLSNSVIVQQTPTFLNITGTGSISGNSFLTTPGNWTFTSSSANGGNQTSFGFQTETAAVPEPSSMVLLGLGAIAAAALVRINRASNLR